MKLALAAVRKLADRFPHALYSAGMDPNELEIAFSDQLENKDDKNGPLDAEAILLEAVRKRSKPHRDARGMTVAPSSMTGPRDRVEELLSSIIGLDHIKSQVSRTFGIRSVVSPENSCRPPCIDEIPAEPLFAPLRYKRLRSVSFVDCVAQPKFAI